MEIALAWLWKLARIVIPTPLIAILAIGAWLYFDRSSAIRKAVNSRVAEMTAGAQIDALEGRLAAWQDIAARQQEAANEAARRATAIQDAHDRLQVDLLAAEFANEDLQDAIDDILSTPASDGCTVDGRLIERLRAR